MTKLACKQIVRLAPDPLILSLDSTTETRSVALYRGAHLLASESSVGHDRGHSTTNLLSEIDSLLIGAAQRVAHVDLFAVACGPGSFTGIRAGLATFKAFAATLKRAVAGISTFHAIALSAGPAERMVVALPAGRGELYSQFLTVAEEGKIVELEPPAHLPPTELIRRAERLESSLIWAGSGSHTLAPQLSEYAAGAGIEWRGEGPRLGAVPTSESGVVWSLSPPAATLAGPVAALALRRYTSGEALTVENLRALYVRLSDAEIKTQCHASGE